MSPMLATALVIALAISPAAAQTCSETATVEVSCPFSVGDELAKAHKTGTYNTCPKESMYWEHNPAVYGGYKGCVSESGFTPCGQNGFGSDSKDVEWKRPFEFKDGACKSTGFTMQDEYLWILWGHPQDTIELQKRSKSVPVINFPLTRMPYPSYAWGGHGDDAADMAATAHDFLAFIGAFTAEELKKWSHYPTEGAEQSMVVMFAAKALEIARTSCNRAIYVFVEAPCYGYSNSRAAQLVNDQSGSFLTVDSKYNLTCPTINTTTPDGKVTVSPHPVSISSVGWLPGTPYPKKASAYVDDDDKALEFDIKSADYRSPFFESLVFPENPTGARKTTQHPSHERRVCDGVYLYPTYFGQEGFKIPAEKVPDCSYWSFSITKIYSAAVRAGTVMYRPGDSNAQAAIYTIVSKISGISEGIHSEWSWYGQIQIWKFIMSKPLSDPTNWVTAYSGLMEEKWNAINDGFKDCPVVKLLNYKTTAYSFWQYKAPYDGRKSSTPSFFQHVMHIQTTSYSWGFRGSQASDYYGAGATNNDFQRMHLYRDIDVYKEVQRRASIVCKDPDAKISGGISINSYKAILDCMKADDTKSVSDCAGSKKRRSLLGFESDEHVAYHQKLHDDHVAHEGAIAACEAEGEITTDCLFTKIGAHQPKVAQHAPNAIGAL